MKRIVKKPEERKQELTEIALNSFLTKGYDKTSIRSILKEVDGEIGMFYHYFKSKDEIYEAALELFNQLYLDKVTETLGKPNLLFEEKINVLFTDLDRALADYDFLSTDDVVPEMKAVIHRQTLLSAIPIFEDLLKKEHQQKTIELPDINTRLLSGFILFGVSAVIHDDEEKDYSVKIKTIKKILHELIKAKNS